ncbi:hypothetical protein [Variovorax paradoxus]|uniref:hypothetical protein n=1 Tax=Variovorax paradoxus TaxID=34073 RepID=UPI0012D4585F|nr:hypothetical protein [Variovorax paradoxus]
MPHRRARPADFRGSLLHVRLPVRLAALRLNWRYLALATSALALAAPQLLNHSALDQWTGGVQRIPTMPEAPIDWSLSPDRWLYLVVLAIALLLFAVAWNRGRPDLEGSPFGELRRLPDPMHVPDAQGFVGLVRFEVGHLRQQRPR